MNDDLRDTARELAGYLPRLEALIPRQPAEGQPAVTMTGATASQPPWYPAAANLALDVHEGTRRIEQEMRQQITGEPHGRRGGSHDNTYRALAAITRLAEAVTPGTARDARRQLARWADRAAQLPEIDEEPRWEPLPRAPGQPPHPCPYCRTYSLRVARVSGMVGCFKPGCADSDGNRPEGRCDLSRLDGSPVVAWRDGLTEGAS